MSGSIDTPREALDRRNLLRWLAAGSAMFVSGCGGSSAGEATGAVNVVAGPGPTPTPTPTSAASPAAAATPAPVAPTAPAPAVAGAADVLNFRSGVSFSTIEGAGDVLPGHLNGQVFVTPASHFAYYAGKGMDHIRLEGSWERLQPRINGTLGEQLFDHYADANNPLRNPVALVRHYLDQAQANGLKVILDLCHNYGERYVGYTGNWANKSKAQLGSAQVPISAFVDYNVKLVQAFGNHPAVIGIELMNEPHDLAIGEAGWRDACQKSIDAIRRIDTKIAIVIDGYGWASAEFWPSRNPTIHTLRDPSNRIIWSAHQYFDASSAGIYGGGSERAPANAQLGVQRLQPFIDWLKRYGFQDRGHIGEFGAPDRSEWNAIVQNFMTSARNAGLRLTAHQDVPYLNDAYTMNLFPATDKAGRITGADRFVIRTLQGMK